MRTARAVLPIALAVVLLHFFVNGRYGFHRDELATLDDARHLAWGFVAYPPVTPFLGRLSLALFGLSVWGARFFTAIAHCISIFLAGRIAHDLGGGRLAQGLAAMAVAISPVALASGSLLQYVAFDYLFWVLVTFFVVRLLSSGDPRWWLAIGAGIGLGMMTKYTMVFLVAGLAASVLATPSRRFLGSKWLWLGAGTALLLFLPNLVWQIQHGFISLDFLRFIHARDVRIGRTSGFLPEQLFVPASTMTIPLWVAGLYFLLVTKEGKPFRTAGWMVVFAFVLFLAGQARGYYTGGMYPVLLAAGAVWWEAKVRLMRPAPAGWACAITWAALAVGGILSACVALPIAPVNSPLWKFADSVNGDFREELGWPELVETVAAIRDSLPLSERTTAGILTGNYGEAGAINLYGMSYGLPTAISGTNSYWLRGYGRVPPEPVIVLGFGRGFVERTFESCTVAGHTGNPYGVRNEESKDHPDIYVCRGPRRSWPDFWREFRRFG
jgi:4-amino-4-deoxy-L-arabinose transferase-like glycosyltransferase